MKPNDEFQISVNERFNYVFSDSDANYLDVISVDGKHFHILKNGESFNAELVNFDLKDRKCKIRVSGSSFEVAISDSFDKLIKDLGFSKGVIHKIKSVNAPMPGLVLSIEVQVGQEVILGEPMVILEAMKMENIIKSPGEGKVKRIIATKGKAVDKGEMLIELE
jgi:biotin carboxyl carrier protein